MNRKNGFLCAALLAGILQGCTTTPKVPANSPDSTAPQLKLGSAGLKKDILLNESSSTDITRRAKHGDEILLLATAEDAQSGIRQVTLDMSLELVCGGNATTQNFSDSATAPAGNTLPVKLVKSYTFKPANARAGCFGQDSKATLTVRTTTENGAGQRSTLPAAQVASFGPDALRVATFNLAGVQNHPDSVYERWGRELGSKADIWLLTEAMDQRRAELVAQTAGMPYVVKSPQGDVAIASRTPLQNVQTRMIEPSGTLTSKNSHVIAADTVIAGTPHRFISTHWGIRDSNNALFPAQFSSPSRLLAANAVLELAGNPPGIVFVGGDMNAYSGSGPQDHDNDPTTNPLFLATAEIAQLYSVFRDPFKEMQIPNEQYCSNQRIDYVLVTGPYVGKSFEACHGNAPAPSDHPFVLVIFEAGDA